MNHGQINGYCYYMYHFMLSFYFSHTIMKYLLVKYGNKEKQALYPSDVREQALVDQAMFFDTGVAFIRVKNIVVSKQESINSSVKTEFVIKDNDSRMSS